MRFTNISGDARITPWGWIEAGGETPDLDDGSGLVEQVDVWQPVKVSKKTTSTPDGQENQ